MFTTNNSYVPIGFGPAENTAARPVLTYTRLTNGLQLSWSGGGALEASPGVTGPYLPVPGGGATPVVVTNDLPTRFFRVAK